MDGQTEKKEVGAKGRPALLEYTKALKDAAKTRADAKAEAEKMIKTAAKTLADAKAEADKILKAAKAKASQQTASAELASVQAKVMAEKSRLTTLCSLVADAEKRLKELNTLLNPKALEEQYSQIKDAKTRAEFRKRYAVELGLA